MAEHVVEAFGPVQIVVNNDELIRPQKPTLELSDADGTRSSTPTCTAPSTRTAPSAAAMVGAGWGRIVNLTGMNAIHGYAGRASFSMMAKHGLSTKVGPRSSGPRG